MLALGRCFLITALNRLKDVAGLVYARPINLGLGLALCFVRAGGHTTAPTLKVDAYAFRFVCLERTGVGLLLRNAYCCQNVQNFPTLDFQFPS